VAEGLEEAVEEELGFAFFVAGDVLVGPCDEVFEALDALGVGHGVMILWEAAARGCGVCGLMRAFARAQGSASFLWWGRR
jgi:hypothetical protein